MEQLIQRYGDLIFDLCESVLWSSQNAHLAFRQIAKELQKRSSHETYSHYERAWILRIAVNHLQSFARKYARQPTPAEKIELDSNENVSRRIHHFNSYFHRLSIEDQIVLLLKDKFGVPYPEIASAMGLPEGSLKIRRQQALRTLEEWLWDRQ